MSTLPDLSEVIRHCDTAFLDEHFAWNADPAVIADKLRDDLRAEFLKEFLERLEHAAGDDAVEMLLVHNPDLEAIAKGGGSR